MIVVGVDGSKSSRDAIRWATEEARLRKTGVRAVYAWQGPPVVGLGYVPSDLLDEDEMQQHAQSIVDAAVAEALAGSNGVAVESRALSGAPAAVLTEASREADLLVLGSRGHGGFAGLLLGSVGQQCVHHAVCPVVIVRPPADEFRQEV